MSSKRIFDVRPDSKFGASFAFAPKVRLFPRTVRATMPPAPIEGIGDSAKTNMIFSVTYWVTCMYRLAA